MSTTQPTHLADLLPRLQRHEPGRPRITWYVLDGGPADGERIELSGAVLANWASKAANLLQDELDAGPGTLVRLDLPPHWRTIYWALAAWHVGATVVTGQGPLSPSSSRPSAPADVVVTAAPASLAAPGGDVVVTLAALARRAEVEVPAGAIDEARELASYADSVNAYARADDDAHALVDPDLHFRCPAEPSGRRLDPVTGATRTGEWLAAVAATLMGDGGVVTVRCSALDDPRIAAVAAQEQVAPTTPMH